MGRNISVDWVSMGIVVVCYAFAQVTSVPLRVRYIVWAIGCAGICGWRVQHYGTEGVNFAITGAAAVLAVFYLVKAMMARTPGSRGA